MIYPGKLQKTAKILPPRLYRLKRVHFERACCESCACMPDDVDYLLRAQDLVAVHKMSLTWLLR